MLTLIKRGCVWRRDERFVELRHLLCVVHGKSVWGFYFVGEFEGVV